MARPASSATKAQVEELRRANKQLKAENIRLKAHLSSKKSFFWRNLAITLCVTLATVVLMSSNLIFWASNTLINTDKYVSTIQQLGANKNIQAAVADYTATQLFKRIDVQTTVTEALPPQADFLAPQLTNQLRGSTEKALQRTLASERFQMVWTDANQKAQERMIAAIKTSKTADGVIDLQDLYSRLGQSLKNTKLNFLADKELPQRFGSITVINAPWIPEARFVVNNVSWLKPVALILVAVFSALAIVLARNKRRLSIALGSIFALSMVATLITIQIVNDKVASHAQPAYQEAARDVASILFQPLAHQTWAILAFSLLAVIITWLTGPYKQARCAISATRRYLTIPLHSLVFKSENSVTRWASSNRQTLQWLIVATFAIVMLLVQLSAELVAVYGALMLLAVLLTEILAAPYSGGKR